MKQITFLIMAVFMTLTSLYSQNDTLTDLIFNPPTRYLNPIDTFSISPDYRKYENELFSLLYTGFCKKPNARFTSQPSFSCQYAFSAEQNANGYYIVSNTLSKDFWEVYIKGQNIKEVTVSKAIIKITQAFYQLIVDLFKLVIDQRKEREEGLIVIDGKEYYRTNQIIFDGVIHNFATTDDNGNLIIGRDRVGDQTIQMDQLGSICRKIYEMSISGQIYSEEEIGDEIIRLISYFKE